MKDTEVRKIIAALEKMSKALEYFHKRCLQEDKEEADRQLKDKTQ